MTGRRAMRGPDERLSRALQYVPGHVGGRVASAQPIRRRGGTLRQASVGAAGTLVPTFVGVDKNAAGSPGVDAEFYAAVGSIAEGDPVLVVAFGHGTVAAPAGWTTLASGTVTDMGYVVAWVPFTGSLDGFGNYTGSLDLTFPVSATTQLLTLHYSGPGATPAATVNEYPADADIAVTTAAPYSAPFSVVGIQYDTGWTWGGVGTSTAPAFTTYSVSRTSSYVVGTTEPELDPSGGTVVVSGSGTPLPDLAEFVIGWA